MREQINEERPLTLEGRWDILYRDYPEVYEEFVSTGCARAPEEAIPRFIEEAVRVVKPGGMIVYLGVPPGYYGGDLDHMIQDEWANEKSPIADNEWKKAGFSYEDYDVEQEYGTLDKIIGIYGFIFGMNAINYLREHNKTTITWRYRWYFKTIE